MFLSQPSCGEKNTVHFTPIREGLSTIAVPSINVDNSKAIDPSQVRTIPVDVYRPAGIKHFNGDVLVLPGWNFSRTRWHKNSNILKLADKYTLRLVFPEMKITLYESSYFPQTRIKWAPVPGGKWIKDIFLPYLQKKYGLFLKKGRNYIMGLSTGGRGVAIIHLGNPDLFKAGAAFSGDFDQTQMRKDRLMTKVYGSFYAHQDRWRNIDNPYFQIGEWTMPVYLGHGRKDRVVPFSQTESFYNALKEEHPRLCIEKNFPEDAGHNFKYWASEVEPAFKFFLSVK